VSARGAAPTGAAARIPGYGLARLAVVACAALLLLAWLAPPLEHLARRFVFVETVQFGAFAMGVPALVTLAGPWRGWSTSAALAVRRLRRRSPLWSVPPVLLYVVATVAWRTPAAVDGLSRHPLLALAEAPTLGVAGVLLWLELVASPPFSPRVVRPLRALLAASAMWATWIVAYVVGFSHSAWFPVYDRGLRPRLSLVGDQELATAVLWGLAAAAYVPVVFANLMAWLRNDEDPDDELRRLLRAERRAGGWGPGPEKRCA
jgi:cytochrome c oxidase assembly factor CtaG